MTIPRWVFGIRFRLILVFALVLTLALSGVSLFVGYAAAQETDRFKVDVEDARVARVKRMVSDHFSNRRDNSGLQEKIEQAASLYDWRISLNDAKGKLLFDSHNRLNLPDIFKDKARRSLQVQVGGDQVGSLMIVPVQPPPEAPPEPAPSRLASSVNKSLLWSGLAAGLVGIALISTASTRMLAPIGTLASTARRLGRGDLSQRVDVDTQDEFGELGHTFNAMAEGLEQAEKQRRSLMADVSHELRTPLSNLQGYIEAVRDGVVQPDRETMDTLHQLVLHLNHLVEDLRLVSLAESGAMRLDLATDSLEDLLPRSINAARPGADAKDVSISLNIAGRLPLVNMDRTRISQVVTNLVDNAISHTPQSGSVTVSAERTERSVRIKVTDTGEGIPPDDLAHVFDRFYRADRSRSRATGGTGLGLTIARQLVEAHGGFVWAESEVGKGSTFIFELPLS